MVGVTYPSQLGKGAGNELGDMLAILISQQVRFNTMDVFLKCFSVPDSFPAQQLFPVLFTNFKDAIYNSWSTKWGQTERINGVDYQKKVILEKTKIATIKQFTVLKLINKI